MLPLGSWVQEAAPNHHLDPDPDRGAASLASVAPVIATEAVAEAAVAAVIEAMTEVVADIVMIAAKECSSSLTLLYPLRSNLCSSSWRNYLASPSILPHLSHLRCRIWTMI